MQTGFTYDLSNPMVTKTERKMDFSAIVVGRVGTWVEIQNVLLGVRPVGNVKGKIILLACAKPNQRNQELIKYKKIGKGKAQAEFLVIKGKGVPLLCKDTAMKLGVLRIGVDIATVAGTRQTLQRQFPEVFSGIGKLKSKQLTLHVDPKVKPVPQPLR